MQVFFLEENLKSNFFKRLFKRVEIIDDRIILNCTEKNLCNKKNVYKITNHIKRFESSYLVISKSLKINKSFINLLESNNLKIANGKKLFKIKLYNILDEICKKYSLNKKASRISILANNYDLELNSFINLVINEYKSINIVTNHYNLFENLQKNILNKYGSILYITNNKKKALCNSNIIINIDFPQELINKYFIYDNSIILNVEEKVKINKKRFQGKIINDYNVSIKNDLESKLKLERLKNYDLKDILECYIICNIDAQKDIVINI